MEKVAQIYKALSEETRLRILMLLTRGELCVCEIMAVLDESQSKVSRHLAYLKHSGLVQRRRVGTWMHYCIREPLDELTSAHLEFIRKELSHCDWAKEDFDKMIEVQARNLCDDPAHCEPVSRMNGSKKNKRYKRNK